ncbi:MAG: ABC transporter permease [Actinomycetota bacterium]|nr:ABC transporter permease [Actinomycetota bacterium]
MSTPTIDFDPALDQAPLRTTLVLASRQFDYWLTVYRRTWRGTAVSSFVMPVLYLAAMGVGLGSFIDSPGAAQQLGGVSYLQFVAPGLLAANAMQTAMGESTFPVYGNFKWTKVYLAMVASPLSVPSVLLANLAYVAFRLVITGAVFLLVLAVFGLVSGVGGGLAALAVVVLVGMAHATPVFAYSAAINHEAGFALLFRLGMIPMFLFSGAFFPVSQLPLLFEWLAYATPLYHGVELSRMLVTGPFAAGMALLHLAYLLAWLVGGCVLARRAFTRRLVR